MDRFYPSGILSCPSLADGTALAREVIGIGAPMELGPRTMPKVPPANGTSNAWLWFLAVVLRARQSG